MVETIGFANFVIGKNQPCFILAEAGVNHNGSLEMAYQLVDAALAAGANAVKFQTFQAEKLISPQASKAAYQIETTGNAETQLEMVKKLELSYAAFGLLQDYCQKKGILFLSTPFDEESADFLVASGMPAIKVPSGEITNLPFLARLARFGKPLIVSTGMSTLGDVESALFAIREAGDPPVCLLHCVSNYPADPSEVNLRAMQTLEQAFGLPVGFSDHTQGIAVPLAAAALGACVIEKHFTLDCSLPGPDHRASLEPSEFAEMVRSVRVIERSLGNGHKQPTAGEANTASVARRSLVAAVDISPGMQITEAMVAIRRPGTGLPPSLQKWLIGRRVKVEIRAGELFRLDLLE